MTVKMPDHLATAASNAGRKRARSSRCRVGWLFRLNSFGVCLSPTAGRSSCRERDEGLMRFRLKIADGSEVFSRWREIVERKDEVEDVKTKSSERVAI